jgi:hypothetical protein
MRLIAELDEKDKFDVFGMLFETMLTKNKFKDYYNNIATL